MKEGGQPHGGPVEGEVSVEAIHHAAMRETADPTEAYDAGPAWFYGLAVATLVTGAFYLGSHYGAFSNEAHIGFAARSPGGPAANASGGAAPAGGAQVSGAAVYTSRCASCHQPDGKGVPGAFPPLAGSEWVTGDPKVLARIILHGLTGPVTVAGASYNGVMPAWASQLSDAEIAAVMTHIRTKLGNSAQPVEAGLVGELRRSDAARTTPWTAAELGG